MMAREVCMTWPEVADTVKQLQYASQAFDCEEVLSILKIAPTGFSPNGGVGDLVWNLNPRPLVTGAGTAGKAGTDLKSVPETKAITCYSVQIMNSRRLHYVRYRI